MAWGRLRLFGVGAPMFRADFVLGVRVVGVLDMLRVQQSHDLGHFQVGSYRHRSLIEGLYTL